MSFFDLILIIIIGGFALFGFWFGLVHTLGSLLGTLLGLFLASRIYVPLADWLVRITGWNENFAKVIMFILAFLVINRLVGFGFFLVDRFTAIITRLPFLNSINRILGAAFGALEGIIVLGIFFYIFARYPFSERLTEAVAHSKIASFTVKTASVIWPLVPDALQKLKSTIEGIL